MAELTKIPSGAAFLSALTAFIGKSKAASAGTNLDWTAITPMNGATDIALRYKVVNGNMTVLVRCLLPAMTAGDTLQVGSIPNPYRPSLEIATAAVLGMYGQVPCRVLLNASGSLRVVMSGTIPASQELNAVLIVPLG